MIQNSVISINVSEISSPIERKNILRKQIVSKKLKIKDGTHISAKYKGKKISHSLIPDEGEFRGSGVRVEALNKAKK